MGIRIKVLLTILLLTFSSALWTSTGDRATTECVYPARCQVNANLNVRSGPSKRYSKIGLLQKYDNITVQSITGPNSDLWGAIDYGGKQGYVSMRYVTYIEPLCDPTTQALSHPKKASKFFAGVWRFLKSILLIIAIILALYLSKYIIAFAIYAGMFAGGGALLFLIFGGSGATGAIVGLVVAAIIGGVSLIIRMDIDLPDINLGGIIRVIFLGAYYIISFPIYFLNRLEHFLVSPWRYFFKENWPSDKSKPIWRVVTEVITVVMYIATTPLRLANAIIYNIFIHCITGIYDLLLEVLSPSDYKEGAKGFWRWLFMLPLRVLKYAIGHVFLLLLESAIWTIMDIFIPSRTFYHGTNLNAGNAITSDPHRNHYLRNTSEWTSGTFLASSDNNCSWAGKGVYFAIQRRLALAYSGNNRSGIGGDAVMIACRVSMGRVITYTLMPDYVYNQAGGGGKHGEINKFADSHGYTMGEWYNSGVWEYCLFDWQNRYNHPWRIRPVYMLNLRTGRAQHVTGGMQHWLFDKGVLENLFRGLL
jgi:uncharacterized protein YgiM (DUF1202 family)